VEKDLECPAPGSGSHHHHWFRQRSTKEMGDGEHVQCLANANAESINAMDIATMSLMHCHTPRLGKPAPGAVAIAVHSPGSSEISASGLARSTMSITAT
jgi:hypothetical protein